MDSSDDITFWIMNKNSMECMNTEIKNSEVFWGTKFEKVKQRHDYIFHENYADDLKKTIRKHTVKSSPMWSMPLENVKLFWKNRWQQCPICDYE
jgi:hypothetical protein